jgi:hypothetical protein
MPRLLFGSDPIQSQLLEVLFKVTPHQIKFICGFRL